LVSLRVSRFFHDDVHVDAVFHMAGISWSAPAGSCDSPMGFQSAVGTGTWKFVLLMGGTIRFRLLQRHADIHRIGARHDVPVQAAFLVCLLSHGDDDARDMQAETFRASALPRKDMSMEEKARQIAELLKILANENRLLILCALVQKPMTVGTILTHVNNITQSALSQHLTLMKVAGILRAEKSGQNITYSIADSRVEEVLKVLKKYYCETIVP
jgi:DNA-binding transcriptional ArsR family regulator